MPTTVSNEVRRSACVCYAEMHLKTPSLSGPVAEASKCLNVHQERGLLVIGGTYSSRLCVCWSVRGGQTRDKVSYVSVSGSMGRVQLTCQPVTAPVSTKQGSLPPFSCTTVDSVRREIRQQDILMHHNMYNNGC